MRVAREAFYSESLGLLQFTRMNAIYRERKKQLEAGVDRLAEDAKKT